MLGCWKNDDTVNDVTANLLSIHHTTPPPLDSDVRADMMRYASIAAVDMGRSGSSELDDSDAAPGDDDLGDKDYQQPSDDDVDDEEIILLVAEGALAKAVPSRGICGMLYDNENS
jgi:hypothetical protein